jgi:hypothetical protein
MNNINEKEIITQAELMKRWKASRQAVFHRIKNHEDFPEPAFILKNRKFWNIKDIEKYERRHYELKSRVENNQ